MTWENFLSKAQTLPLSCKGAGWMPSRALSGILGAWGPCDHWNQEAFHLIIVTNPPKDCDLNFGFSVFLET